MKDDVAKSINSNVQSRYNEIMEKYYSLMNNTREGIFFVKYDPDIIMESNRAFEELFSLKKEEVIGKKLDLINATIPKKLLEIVKRCISENKFTVMLSDSKESIIEVNVFYRKDDNIGAVCINLSDNYSRMDYNKLRNYLKYINTIGKPTVGKGGTQHQVSEATNTSSYRSEKDKMLLPEKDFFYWQLKKEIARYKRGKRKFAVSFIAIERLKEIYTSVDSKLSNILQNEISSRLLLSIRGEDTIANYNESEYAMIQTLVNSKKDIDIVTSKLFKNMEKPIIYNGILILNVNIGVSIFPDDGNNFNSILAAAESAKLSAIEKGEKLQYFENSSMGENLESLMEQNKILRQLKKR